MHPVCSGSTTAATTVLTNGVLLAGRPLETLRSLPRDRVTLQISLDSPEPARHDRHRGRGTWTRAWHGHGSTAAQPSWKKFTPYFGNPRVEEHGDRRQPHGSLLTRRWREVDSNFQFRARWARISSFLWHEMDPPVGDCNA